MKGALMVDTVYGKVRIRAWPKKRGRPRSAATVMQNARFASAQRLAKTAPYQLVNRLIDATKGTGLYPRDLLTQQILAPRFTIIEEDGQEVSFRRAQVRSITMQGFLLKLTSNQAVAGSTTHQISWPVPVLDTADFWNVATPDRITIPEHVTGMAFFGAQRNDGGGGLGMNLLVLREAPSQLVMAADQGDERRSSTINAAPVPVEAGETYSLTTITDGNTNLLSGGTWFGGIIIGTDF